MIKVVITDLDNTLYDWVGFYIPSFLAMVAELSRLSGRSEVELKAAFKRVHERHRLTEYAFAIEELDILGANGTADSVRDRLEKYQSAIRAFRQKRTELLHLYNGVAETLSELRRMHVLVAALTDTTTYYASRRLEQLRINDLFDLLCAPEDHGIPPGIDPGLVRKYPDETKYGVSVPTVLAMPSQWRKPDTRLVASILSHTGVQPTEAILVGDSISRDVAMAQRAGVWDVHAAYGERIPPALYCELLEITYWAAADCANSSSNPSAEPRFVINSFPELLQVIQMIQGRAKSV